MNLCWWLTGDKRYQFLQFSKFIYVVWSGMWLCYLWFIGDIYWFHRRGNTYHTSRTVIGSLRSSLDSLYISIHYDNCWIRLRFRHQILAFPNLEIYWSWCHDWGDFCRFYHIRGARWSAVAAARANLDLVRIYTSVAGLVSNSFFRENLENSGDMVHSTLDICFCFCKVGCCFLNLFIWMHNVLTLGWADSPNWRSVQLIPFNVIFREKAKRDLLTNYWWGCRDSPFFNYFKTLSGNSTKALPWSPQAKKTRLEWRQQRQLC